MRILHIINDLSNVGGAENMLINILKLMALKEDITVLVLKSVSDLNKGTLLRNNVRVVELNSKKYRLSNYFNIKNFVRCNNFDIIHLNLFPSLYWGCLPFLFNKDIKIVYTEHSTFNKRRNYWVFRYIESIIYRRLDVVIAISEGVRDAVLKWQPVIKQKVVVIPNGINTKLPTVNEVFVKGTPKDARILLMISRFTPAKDHVTLIKSLSYLDDCIHLWLVGDGETIDDCKEYAKKLNLSNRVHFIGNQLNIYDYIMNADVCILSSHWEGFGLSAVECMVAGKPTLVSNVPGLKSLAPNEFLIFEVQDFIGLSNSINLLLKDGDLYLKMADLCYKKALDFDVENTVKQYCATYKNVINRI